MNQQEAERLSERMRAEIEKLVKESQDKCDEFTKNPRPLKEIAEFMAARRKDTQDRLAAIFDKYYDRYSDRPKE
jgi:hypothetical protein